MQKLFRSVLAALTVFGLSPVWAQKFPDRQVTLVSTAPAGGTIDTVARVVAKGLAQSLGQPVIVENRSGAGGNIAAAYVAQAPADGHILLITSSSTLTINPHIYKSLSFHPQKSFSPVTVAAGVNLVLVVHPKLDVSNLQEFLTLLRSKPGKLNYASTGSGSLPHLGSEMFSIRTGTRGNHIPYKGVAPALNDLLAGHIDYMFDAGISASHVKAGKLRALAVIGPNRMEALPEIRTLKELGIEDMTSAAGWFGILAPAGTPNATIQRLNADIRKVLDSQAEMIASIGLQPITSSPDELSAMISEGLQSLGEVVKRANISSQ